VLVLVDVAADGILLARDLRFFLRRQRATGLQVLRLRAIEVLLVAFELAGLLARQLSGLQALFDALLLVRVALGGDGGRLLLGVYCGAESERQHRGGKAAFHRCVL